MLINCPETQKKKKKKKKKNGIEILVGQTVFYRRCMKLIWAKSQCPSQSPLSYWIT